MFAPHESLKVRQERDELFYALQKVTDEEIVEFRRCLSGSQHIPNHLAEQIGIWGAEEVKKSQSAFWEDEEGMLAQEKTKKIAAWKCIVNRLTRGILKPSVEQFTDKKALSHLSSENLDYLKSLDAHVEKTVEQTGEALQAAFAELRDEEDSKCVLC